MSSRISLPTVPPVSCTDPPCGKCCQTQAGLPVTWYGVLEPDAPLPDALRAEVEATIRGWRESGRWPKDGDPCVWLDPATKLCRHYEHRPDVCRELELGGESCLAWREGP